MYNDDDDPELADTQELESPSKAKLQALQQKMKKEGLQQATEKTDLQELKKTMIKHQVEKKKGPKKGKEKPERRETSFKTPTREQEIRRSKLTADTALSPDLLLKQANEGRKAKEELKEEEIQGEGG